MSSKAFVTNPQAACSSCGNSLAGADNSFGERVCTHCGAVMPLEETAAFARNLRLERDRGAVPFATLVLMFLVAGVAQCGPGAAMAVVVLAFVVPVVVLVRRHGSRAVEYLSQEANETSGRSAAMSGLQAGLGRGVLLIARHLRQPQAKGVVRTGKIALGVVSGLGLVLGLAVLVGLVGFRYPRIKQVSMLDQPLQVSSVRGRSFVLRDGREFLMESFGDRDLTAVIAQSENQVDLKPAGNQYLVFVTKRNPDTNLGPRPPIHVPLIPVDVPTHVWDWIGFATPVHH